MYIIINIYQDQIMNFPNATNSEIVQNTREEGGGLRPLWPHAHGTDGLTFT